MYLKQDKNARQFVYDGMQELSGLLQLVQQPVAQTPSEKEKNDDSEEAVLDFLDSF